MILADIESAIVTALNALKTAGTLATVDAVSEKAADLEAYLAASGAKAPFALLVYGGGGLAPLNPAGGLYRHSPAYHLLLGVSAARSPQQAAGTLYGILAAILNALGNQTLSLAIDPIQFTGIELMEFQGPVTIYDLKLQTQFRWDVATEATP